MMKKTKFAVFVLLGYVLFNITGIRVFSENKADIVVMEYNQSDNHITDGEEFTLNMIYKKFIDTEISDIYLTIDNSSAFVTAQAFPLRGCLC
jgi:hypothetical protein